MTIARICQRDVDSAMASESVRTAAQRMSSRSVGTLLVLDAQRRPIGILTDRDLALRVVSEGRVPATTSVEDVMTRGLVTLSDTASIDDALALMRAKAVRRLPVVGGDGRVVGLVSMDDILALMAHEMWQLGRLIARSSPSALAEA
ncbi:MAG: CBS domain-containing protein [Planctomycetes bacterium]|nr:CBS domain-containing protein [Planctomycetota bacterium]